MHLILDTHRAEIQGTEFGHFLFAVNAFGDAAATSNAYEVHPGHRTWISLVLSMRETEEKELREYGGPESRGCRYPDEEYSAFSLQSRDNFFREQNVR